MEIENISKRKAALIIGIGILSIAIIAPFAEFAILTDNIDSEDLDQSRENLKENRNQILIAFVIYALVVLLELGVIFGMYSYFRSVNRNKALLAAGLRFGYVVVISIGLIGLLVPSASLFIYGQLVAYAFFIPHLLVMGNLSYYSRDVPRLIGGAIMVGSVCYIYLTYGEYLISGSLFEIIFLITLLPAVIGELSLAIWMLVRGGKDHLKT